MAICRAVLTATVSAESLGQPAKTLSIAAYHLCTMPVRLTPITHCRSSPGTLPSTPAKRYDRSSEATFVTAAVSNFVRSGELRSMESYACKAPTKPCGCCASRQTLVGGPGCCLAALLGSAGNCDSLSTLIPSEPADGPCGTAGADSPSAGLVVTLVQRALVPTGSKSFTSPAAPQVKCPPAPPFFAGALTVEVAIRERRSLSSGIPWLCATRGWQAGSSCI
mmetsp:Transcript_8666/g.17947  ORF Transcript_8666/g.17947 Transcript_8666/m.17947 type:complete len:222 (+) Transcript_8666:443-1108(+)